jgi:pimeloyl-ACP methyl ester carboxylesterase
MQQQVQLFLLIGLTKESGHWDRNFILSLQSLFQSDDIVLMDLPGTGKFIDQKSPFRIPLIVRKTRENYVSQIRHHKKRILISISLGGMLAAEWSWQFPDDFHEVVIINSSFRGVSPIRRRLQPEAMKSFIRIFLTKNSIKREERILKLCSNNPDVISERLPEWVEISKIRPVKKYNMVRQTIAGALYKPRQKPASRLLIIAARHDRLADYRCSVDIHQQWGGDLLIFDDKMIGHAMHVDAPYALANAIFKWSSENTNLEY